MTCNHRLKKIIIKFNILYIFFSQAWCKEKTAANIGKVIVANIVKKDRENVP